MRGKKAMLGEVLGRSGMASALLRALPGGRDRLLVLAYHRVLDLPPHEDDFAQDPELVSAGIEDFERQMRFVCRHFTPLSFAEVLAHLDAGRPLPPRPLVVTFDDGHLDNHRHAFPVLKSLGMPACIFLSTDYIGSRRMFWFDRVALLLWAAPAGEWTMGGERVRLAAGDAAARREAAGRLLRSLKRVPDAERRRQVDALEAQFGPHVPAGLAPERSALDWNEVAEMAAGGIEFGSHTLSHPILSQLDDDALAHELSASREAIARRTGRAVDTIAYPVGKAGAYDARVIAAAQRAGYRLGISYETGVNALSALDRFEVRRLAVERYTSRPFFESLLALPGLLA